MTTEEFDKIVADWIATAKHLGKGLSGRHHTSAVPLEDAGITHKGASPGIIETRCCGPLSFSTSEDQSARLILSWDHNIMLHNTKHGGHEDARSQTVKVIGTSGQISLGKQYAGKTVLVEEVGKGVWLLRIARVIPESEA